MKLLKKLLRKRHYRFVSVYFLAYLMLLSTPVSVVVAGPEGAQVVNGQVTFQQGGNNTVITASNKAIINYSSFDIARPEIVEFIQPGSSASVLNRILSANPTSINGTLLANGRVFFVNPAGIYFGEGAKINVSQLVASGLNISNSDFINGIYNFAGGSGSVMNYGDIAAESAILIGKQVANHGSINCPAGYVIMAAGDRVFIGEPGSDMVLEVDVTSSPEQADPVGPGILNEGTVEAAGGKIVLAAGDIYSQAISNTGSLSASVDIGDAGQIKLAAGGEVTNTGTIEASGSQGGQVAMEGTRVGQFGTIHADGADSHGGNVDLWASDVVALSSGSLTTANAGVNGDGGSVTVYSPEMALFHDGARIEAKGGSESGDGGFIEVSGKRHVEVYGLVDATAPGGSSGTFLVDPYNVEITNPDKFGSWSGPDPDVFAPTASGSQIKADTLETHLASANVTVTTTSVGILEDGDITVSSSIDYSGTTNDLTLQAENDIVVNDTITGGSNNLTLTANSDSLAGGDVNVNQAISAAGVSLSGVEINLDATITAGTLSGTTDTVAVLSNSASIQNAIDVASPGATITVKDGTYTEDLTVNKANLTLQSENGAYNETDGTTIELVDGVGIDIGSGATGFKLGVDDGDPDNDIDYGFEIVSGGTTTFNIQLTNGPSNVEISSNIIDTSGNASMGISVGNSGAAGLNINNNTFIADDVNPSSWADGAIWGPIVSGATVSNNDFTASSGTPGYAIQFSGLTNSTISENTITDYGQGISIFHGEGVSNLIIEKNVITGCTNGIRFGEYKATAGPDGDITSVTVRNNTVTGGTNAIRLHPDGSHVLASNIAVYENDFSGNTYGVKNESTNSNSLTNVLDASGNWWGDADGPEIASNTFNVGDQGVGIDEAVAGTVEYVRWLDSGGDDGDPDNGFQPTGSLFAPVTNITDIPDTYYSSIGSGISSATAADTLQIDDGTFTEAVTVDKSLTLTVPSGTAEMTSLNSDGGTTTGLSGDFGADSFQFTGAVTLAGPVELSTGSGTGNIDFQSTLNGTETLALTAGTGDIDFDDTVGNSSPLAAVTINSAQNVTMLSTFEAASLTQLAGTGITQLGGVATLPGGLALTTATIDIDDNVITTGTDVDLIATTLVDLDASASITTTAAVDSGTTSGEVDVDVSGTGTVNLAGDVVTTGAANSTGTGSVGGAVTINTTDDTIAVANITSTGGAATVLINDGGAAGVITLDTGADNTITLNGNLIADGGTSALANKGVGGAITLKDPTLLGADIAISTGADTAGKIDFESTLNGTQTLALTAGTGDIDFDDTVGNSSPLGAVTINSAQNVAAADVFEAASLTQSAGSGVTTLSGNVTTTAPAGLDITASAISLGMANIDTEDGKARFNGPTTLTENLAVDTTGADVDAGDGTITFANTLDAEGPATGETLGLTAGQGNVDFDATVGNTNPLGAVTINSAHDVTADAAFTAESLEQDVGTGKMWFTSITTKGADNQPGGEVDIQIAGDIQIDNKIDATGGIATSPGQDGADVTLSGDEVIVGEIDTSGSDATGGDSGGNAGDIQITSTGNTSLNGNLTALGGAGAGGQGADGTINVSGGTDGTGDVGFDAAGIILSAPTITLRAGDGPGGGGTDAKVNFVTNLPKVAAGNTSFTIQQDGAITNTPDHSQFLGGVAGVDLVVQSDDSSINSTSAHAWKSIAAAAEADINLWGSGEITTKVLNSSSDGVFVYSTGAKVNATDTVQADESIWLVALGDVSATTLESSNGDVYMYSLNGDLIVNNPLIAHLGGVFLMSVSGKIYTPGGADDTLNVAITGYSDPGMSGGIPLPPGFTGTAAIVIKSYDDLKLGSGATLTANGTYDPTIVDDRGGVNFAADNDPIDVAIYLGSANPSMGNGNVEVGSDFIDIEIDPLDEDKIGTLIIDAFDTVTFTPAFESSLGLGGSSDVERIEVVSRYSEDLAMAMGVDRGGIERLPHADDPEALANGEFAVRGGIYALRGTLDGSSFSEARLIAVTDPVPLVPPAPFEPEISGEVEQPDVEAIRRWAEENNIPLQPFLVEAYMASLSTDLQLLKAAETLRDLAAILQDSDGTHLNALALVFQEIGQPMAPTEEGMARFAQELADRTDDETNYALAGQWIDALVDFVATLNTGIGYPADTSIVLAMRKYARRLTEPDHIAFVQAYLQMKSSGG